MHVSERRDVKQMVEVAGGVDLDWVVYEGLPKEAACGPSLG